MDKNTNASGSTKDSFKNTPHVDGANTTSKTASSASVDRSSMVNNVREKIADQAGPAIDSIRSQFSRIQESGRPYLENAGSYVRRYPMYSLLGAAAAGALIGMAIARPSSRYREE